VAVPGVPTGPGAARGRAQRLTVGEERLGQLSEEGFQQAADDVQVLPPLLGERGLLRGTTPGKPRCQREKVPKPGEPQATDAEGDTSQHHRGCAVGRTAVPTRRLAGTLCVTAAMWRDARGQMCPQAATYTAATDRQAALPRQGRSRPWGSG